MRNSNITTLKEAIMETKSFFFGNYCCCLVDVGGVYDLNITFYDDLSIKKISTHKKFPMREVLKAEIDNL